MSYETVMVCLLFFFFFFESVCSGIYFSEEELYSNHKESDSQVLGAYKLLLLYVSCLGVNVNVF